MNKFLFLSFWLFTHVVFGQFSRPRIISTCEFCYPRTIHMIDIDQDGDQDLFTTSLHNHQVAWYRNNGAGDFGEKIIIAQNFLSPLGINAGDLDGDKHMDLIFTSFNEKKLYWYKNDGQANFTLKSLIDSSITRIYGIALADLNGDKHLDIVATASPDSTPYSRTFWYANDGKGNFSQPNVIVANYSNHIQTGDMDGDGDLDVVGGSYWYTNDGQGNFIQAPIDEFNSFYYSTLADLNKDNKLDIVAIQNGSAIVWLRNEGNGRFSRGVGIGFALTANITQFAVGDIDGDGDPDLAYGYNNTNTNLIVWSKNDGLGNFAPIEEVASDEATLVQMADIDNDKRLDVIAASSIGGVMNWYRNNVDLSFSKRSLVKNLASNVSAVHSGDLNGDGQIDILLASVFDNKIWWWKNDGKKGFIEPSLISDQLQGINSINAADFDQDGDLDAIAVGTRFVVWYRNDGRGNFTDFGTIYLESNMGGLQANVSTGDLDKDGDLDIFYMAFERGSFVILWHKNDGQGNFGPSQIVVICNERNELPNFCAADLDNDGDLDIAYELDYRATLAWVRNDGAGNFSKFPEYTGLIGTAFRSNPLFPADVDGDQDIDILSPEYWGSGASSIDWYKNGGTGFFDETKNALFGSYAVSERFSGIRFMNVGDIDQDGDQDVVVARDKDRKLVWYRNNGQGVFSPTIQIAAGTDEARPLHLADLDKDGDLDVLTFHEFLDKVFWYENVEPLPTIEGVVFWDKNENGKMDNGEDSLSNLPVRITPEALSSYTDFDGKFHFFVPNGQYQLSAQAEDCWEATTGALRYSVRINNNAVDTIKFALKPKGQSPRPQASLHAGPTRCGFEVPFWLTVQNTGCGLSKGRYAVVLSPLVKLISTQFAPVEVRGDTLFWDYTDLATSQVEQVSFVLQVAGTEFIGDSIRLKALAWLEKSPGILDPPTTTNFIAEIRCAYDPNDKLVLPNRTARYTQNYTLRNEKLEYTIRFQNTGNDTAFTVVILDTLDQNLDWRTFQMLTSSHNVETQLSEGGVLKFTFRNILLPDSTTNERLSHGFVSFRISPKVGLPENIRIHNSASIYFDFNPPIKTNTTNSVIVSTLPQITNTTSAQENKGFQVFPNPFYNRLYVQSALPEQNLDAYHLQLWNSQGQLVLTRRMAGRFVSVDLPDLAAGLYFYVLIDPNVKPVGSGKIVRR